MKHTLWLFLIFVLWSPTAQAAISAKTGPGSSAVCQGAMGGTATCTTPALTLATGDRMVLVSLGGAGQVFNTSCGLTFSAVVTSTSSPQFTAQMSTAAGSALSCTVSRTGSGSAWNAVIAVQVYAGVGGTGMTNNGQAMTGNTANCSAALTGPVSGAGNWVVGAFYWNNANFAASLTTARVAAGMTTISSALSDAVGSTTANVSATVDSPAGYCNRIAFEMIPAGQTGRVAAASDAMQTIVLATPNGIDYELPAQLLLAGGTWCAWVMPSGPASSTYHLTTPAGTNINNQGNSVVLPSWQMTRVCQNNTGSYWLDPPFLAGSGITLTPTALGTTIAATGGGGGGGVTRIAGGTYTLPSGVAFASNTCTSIPVSGSVSAPGVVDTDVIMLTRQSTASGWGNGSLIISAIPFTGVFQFEVCNNGASTITPGSTLPMNWLVLR